MKWSTQRRRNTHTLRRLFSHLDRERAIRKLMEDRGKISNARKEHTRSYTPWGWGRTGDAIRTWRTFGNGFRWFVFFFFLLLCVLCLSHSLSRRGKGSAAHRRRGTVLRYFFISIFHEFLRLSALIGRPCTLVSFFFCLLYIFSLVLHIFHVSCRRFFVFLLQMNHFLYAKINFFFCTSRSYDCIRRTGD